MWLIKHRPTNLTIQMSTPAHVCSLHASCMFMWGGQRPVLSVFPNAPGSRTEAWWNHRKLDCLPFALEAARKRHSFPPTIPAASTPPSHLTRAPKFPLWRHVAPNLCFYMSSKVSPCDAETLGCMSAECSIKQLLAQWQQESSSTV